MIFRICLFSIFTAIFISACASHDDDYLLEHTNALLVAQVAKDLNFKVEDRGMHQYHFYNGKYEFDLLASDEEIFLTDESSLNDSKFTPIYQWKGNVSAEEVVSKIRVYLYGNK